MIFHRVLEKPDPLLGDPDVRRFDEICRWVTRWFNVLPLDIAYRRLKDGSLPARALAITFDDGYADNWDLAVPILRSHGLVATFFVATGFLDGGRMWNDTVIEAVRRTSMEEIDLGECGLPGLARLGLSTMDQRRFAIERILTAAKYLPVGQRDAAVAAVARASRATLPNDLMMPSVQVGELRRAGMGVGGHTVNHPILATLAREAALDEIRRGKVRLEDLTQEDVTLFAYPNGRPGRDFLPESVALAREAGFDAAVTTAWGAADRLTDPFLLPRFTPWDGARWAFGLRMARNLMIGAAPPP